MMDIKEHVTHPAFELRISKQESLRTPAEIVHALISTTEDQCESMKIEDDDERVDFALGCDALNFWRLRMRLKEDFGEEGLDDFMDAIGRELCEQRSYDDEEFDLALLATKDRPRFPFGYPPLQLALVRAQRKPIRILVAGLGESRLLSQILCLAIQLREINGEDKPVLLPVESIRKLLSCRKLAVSGAIKRLLQEGLLIDTGGGNHEIRRAREFQVAAQCGIHFEFEKQEATGPTPHL